MPYSISCPCGKTLEVSAMQAGSTIACDCGQAVDVPAMSVLRRSAGQSAIPLNIVEKIHGMVHRDELPDNAICPLSGKPADVTELVKVQCERSFVLKKDPKDLRGLFTLVASYFSLNKSAAKMVGRDVSINVPLAIAGDQLSKFTSVRSQNQLKDWLGRVPIYQELLDEYPEATLTPYVP